jgi:hypothetical protein
MRLSGNHTSEDNRGRWRARTTIAGLLALCVLAGTQALAPVSVSAMTNEELAQICSGAAELGSSVCISDTQTGSGGGGGEAHYGATEPRRGEIVITAPKPLEPAYFECGWGFQASRPVDCPKQRKGDAWLDQSPPNRGVQGRPSGIGVLRSGPPESKVSCLRALEVRQAAEDALHFLARVRLQLGDRDNFRLDEALRVILRDNAANWQPWLSKKEWEVGFGKIYPDWLGVNRKSMDSWRDRTLVENYDKAWKKARDDAEKLSRTPTCLSVLGGAKS